MLKWKLIAPLEEIKKYDRQALSGVGKKHAIRHLHEIGCVEPTQSEADTWWLREWISPAYR